MNYNVDNGSEVELPANVKQRKDRPPMKSTVVAKATFRIDPREYLVHLHQTGPRTFVWKYAYGLRLSQVENFRSKEAALAFATENAWTIQ